MQSLTHLSSYPTVFTLGHKALEGLFSGPVVVQEKIDGSQFSMARVNGELFCRSKGQVLVVTAPEQMFAKAVEAAQGLPLRDGWVYRCEYLQSPKHNSLAYDRVPTGYLMLFDVMTGPEVYLSPQDMADEAARLGLESVPLLTAGQIANLDMLSAYLGMTSVLGGQKIEGVVVKNYAVFTPEKKIACGKFVSEQFKETHRKEWAQANPTRADVVQLIILSLRTEARWNKSIQHLREAGLITDSPKDIGPLLKEIQADVEKEESDSIKEQLFRHFWPHIKRGVIAGFPEHYKEQLAKSAFA